MRTLRRLLLPVAVVTVGIAVQLLLLRGVLRQWAERNDGPQTLGEAARAAAGRGFHVLSGDRRDGTLANRLVVSDRPLSWERANLLRFGDPHHPCWAGTAVVCTPLRGYLNLYDPDYAAIWGRLFLYGDRGLIRRLTGQ